MESVVGVFGSRSAAESAVNGLHAIGLSPEAITFLTPHVSEERLGSVPTTDAESPGMGKAVAGYVGGVVGGGIGLQLGSALASLFVPGVGPILAAGFGAAALLGLGGAAVGASIGSSSEKSLDDGVPRDDVLFYRQLLQQGRSIVVALTESEETTAAARAVVLQHGAEDVDEARKHWQNRAA